MYESFTVKVLQIESGLIHVSIQIVTKKLLKQKDKPKRKKIAEKVKNQLQAYFGKQELDFILLW